MPLSRRPVVYAVLAVILVLALWLGPDEEDPLQDKIIFDAEYDPAPGTITITFEDTTAEITSATMEIQGLAESYQKTFSGYSFTETVDYGDPPSLGWRVHPLTIAAEHPERGIIGIKTEVHAINQEAPEILIYEIEPAP